MDQVQHLAVEPGVSTSREVAADRLRLFHGEMTGLAALDHALCRHLLRWGRVAVGRMAEGATLQAARVGGRKRQLVGKPGQPQRQLRNLWAGHDVCQSGRMICPLVGCLMGLAGQTGRGQINHQRFFAGS